MKYDFVFSNHFLHHFDNDQIVDILNRLFRINKSVLLMNDLYRSKTAYLAYKLFAFLFLHNSFASYDGGISILKGFTLEEMEHIIKKSEYAYRIKIRRKFPGRIVLFASVDRNS